MGTPYETDVAVYAREQAAPLRGGMLSAIDALHVAEEIEDVGESEHRALDSHPRAQRAEPKLALRRTPSLKHAFDDEEWLTLVWLNAVAQGQKESKLELPETWIWSIEHVLHEDFWPD